MSDRTLLDDFFLFVTIMYVVDIIVRMLGLGWKSYSANGWNIFDIIVAGGSLFATLIVRFNTGGFVIQQLQKLFITSIAFKLVQRVNSLNKLFKTAVYVLPSYMCVYLSSRNPQGESSGYSQSARALGHLVPVLRHPLRGGLQFDEVEHGRSTELELLQYGEGVSHVSLYDNRVRAVVCSLPFKC